MSPSNHIWQGDFLDGSLNVSHSELDEGHIYFSLESEDGFLCKGELHVNKAVSVLTILDVIETYYLHKLQEYRDAFSCTLH